MYEILNFILGDRTTDTFSFKPFSLCHIIYFIIVVIAITLMTLAFKNKSKETQNKLINITVNIALCLYILDFLVMPFSMQQISQDKLPFHLCTLMSIMCYLSRNNKTFARFKTAFTLLGMIGAIAYLVYPAGVQNGAGDYFDGYTYRIVQTVIYHGLMVAQGVFAIFYKEIDINWKNFKYDVYTVLGLTVWSLLGNYTYTGRVVKQCDCSEGCEAIIDVYNNSPNWFFTKHDVLYIISDEIDVYIAPFMMIVGIIGLSALVRFLSGLLYKYINK